MSNLPYEIGPIKTFIIFDDMGRMRTHKASTLIQARQENPDALFIKALNDVKYFIASIEKGEKNATDS